MKSRHFLLSAVVLLVLLLVIVLGPGVCTLYKIETHPPQIETLYQATADGEAPEKIVYEIPGTFRRDYRHLDLDIEAQDPGTMGCSIEYVLANDEKFSASFKETSSFHRFTIPSEHIRTIQRIEISELENISCITMWNSFISP